MLTMSEIERCASFDRFAPLIAFGGSKVNVQGFEDRFGGGIARFENSQNVEMNVNDRISCGSK
jgi:hypothetical protein